MLQTTWPHRTGAKGVFRPENVDCANDIGVFLEATRNTTEPSLCAPVVGRHLIAGAAGVLGRHRQRGLSRIWSNPPVLSGRKTRACHVVVHAKGLLL